MEAFSAHRLALSKAPSVLKFSSIELLIFFINPSENTHTHIMIYLKTMLKCIDNSGAQMVECIKVLRKNPKNFASIGDKIVCVVQKARPSTSTITGASASNRVKRGDIVRAVIVRTKKETQRPDGSVIKFDDNACVLLNKNDEPIATRIGSVVAKELRDKNFNKIVSLAPKVV
ncbi:BA75_03547T0 [Komagataella pastoris]|uniref:Large ribosomal subunit protein uL14m n=1 Tax=Komagataella pastoris TaxID=4922 RepID=A0A1B2JGG6_PICPA|nr:BA75_03547T0 [Komagataella pastoris]